jgi:hypoxanthine phosphoribosyltransferase
MIVQQKKVLKYTKYICGIPRGGYPIAVHLAHHLNKKFIEYYHLDRKQEEETILVDDIADTGATFKLHASWETLATATLFYKQRSSYEPMFYVEVTDQWIVFPWERTDEIPNRPV